jgi:hypothetical protein
MQHTASQRAAWLIHTSKKLFLPPPSELARTILDCRHSEQVTVHNLVNLTSQALPMTCHSSCSYSKGCCDQLVIAAGL